MEVVLKRTALPMKLEATNERGLGVVMDAGPALGGSNQGYRPMELVLAALAGCSSMDVIHILGKQRQNLVDIEVRAQGEREPEATPSPFVKLHLHFSLRGEIDEAKALRAVDLAVKKYCSVGAMLEHSAPVTFSLEVNSHAVQIEESL